MEGMDGQIIIVEFSHVRAREWSIDKRKVTRVGEDQKRKRRGRDSMTCEQYE